MSDTTPQRRSERRPIDLEQLKSDPASFLSLGLDDPTLRKLETYRLYRVGYAVEDIAQAFGFARSYLYELWAKLKAGGTEALVDKRWGSTPRTRTPEREAQVLRAKALNPQRRDADLGQESKMDRSTVYELLDDHGLQDLHRVLTATLPTAASSPSTPETESQKEGSNSSPAPTP